MKDKEDKLSTYEPDSIWSNLKYGIITIILLVGPLFIPGVTILHWIMVFFGFTIIFSVIVCILGIWQNLVGYKQNGKRTNRRTK
jgi:hypothetical protein